MAIDQQELLSSLRTSATARTLIQGEEFKTKRLPQALINSDGTLKLYDDVRKLLNPVFEHGYPAIQFGGWVGYISLNDEYALEVNPRVPIGNLERLIRIAFDYSPNVLRKYTRQFMTSDERPGSILDVVTERFVELFDRICESGFLKTYVKIERVGSNPVGRIDPFKTAWKSKRAGRPVAVSSSFQRTKDFGPNRLLRAAFEKLYAHYLLDYLNEAKRLTALRKSLARLADVEPPASADLDRRMIAQQLMHLPAHHEHYVEAISLAQLIISGSGIAIRRNAGPAILPSILIDMSDVFENYIRKALAENLAANVRLTVKDGNKEKPEGAKDQLFDPIEPDVKNSAVTPDIVVEVDGVPRLISRLNTRPLRRSQTVTTSIRQSFMARNMEPAV